MLHPRRQPVAIRTTVVIPATVRHEQHLPELITALERQTVRPDEVAISISECLAPSQTVQRRVRASPLRIRLRTDRATAYAGRNRNLAADASSGNLLVYQDADDLPHPQRVEIIAHLFGRYEVHHLMHHYQHALAPHVWRAWETHRFNMNAAGSTAYYQEYGSDCAHPFHNGNNATSRVLFVEARWPEHLRRGQDVAYNRSVISTRFASRMARLPWQLVSYRQYLSSLAYASRQAG